MNLASSLRPGVIPPAGNPLQGGERRFVRTEPLFRNQAGSGFFTANTADFEIWIPSTRLMTIVTFGFLPDFQEDVVIPAGWTVTMDAWGVTESRGFGSGRRVRGNQIIPGPFALPNQLPLSYEAVTGVDQWRGRVTVPSLATGLAMSGYLLATVSWEPAAGESSMGDEELRRIFTACKLTPGAGAGGTVFESGIL